MIGGSRCDLSTTGNGIDDAVSDEDLTSNLDEDVSLGRSGNVLGVAVAAGIEAGGGVSGALRPNPLIMPGMWLRGLKELPKFFIDSNGVVAGLELNIEEAPAPGLGVEKLFRGPVENVFALCGPLVSLLRALSALLSRGVLRPSLAL